MKNKKSKSKSPKPQIEVIEEKIIRLQQATSTIYPSASYWHVELCRRSPLYYAWHKNRASDSLHWMIFTLLILYLLWINSMILFSILGN